MSPDTPAAAEALRAGRALAVLRALPLALFAYPVLAAMLGRSEVPTVLGRYSPFLASLLLGCVLVAAAWAWSYRRDAYRREQLALLAVVALSYVLPGSNQVRDLPFVGLALPALRLCSAVALAVLELQRSRERLGRGGAVLGLAGVLAVSAVCDVGLALASRARPVHAATGADPRVDYDVTRLSDAGVILVGDSFVWGQGVARAERFGDRLEALGRARGLERPVYSFGAVGANVRHYAHVLAAIPEKPRTGRIVLSFYVNDLPPAARLAERAREQLIALGTGAPTLRVLGDAAALALAPDLERFNQIIVEDYDPRDPTFAARWKILERDLASFAELAKTRSVRPPLLLILPLMVDFERYPLTEAHGRLRALGERLGFEVLDMLPTFLARLRDGSKHLAAPNDNHFDAATHELVARALLQTL